MKLSINDFRIAAANNGVHPVYPALMWCWNDGDDTAEIHTVTSEYIVHAASADYTVNDISQPYSTHYQHAVPVLDLLYDMPSDVHYRDDDVVLGRVVLASDGDDERLYLRYIECKNATLFVQHPADRVGYDHVIEPEERHIECAVVSTADDDCAKTPPSDATIAQLQNVDYKDTSTLADDRCCEKFVMVQPDIAKVLVQRGTVHGDFTASSGLATSLQFELRQSPNWHGMRQHQQRALNMICEKITRICYGDPNFADHWIDIAGYATLGKDGCHE